MEVARATGAPILVEFEGEELRLYPAKAIDTGAAAHEMLKRRRNPLELVRPMLSDETIPLDMRKAMFAQALANTSRDGEIPIDEIIDWYGTVEGFNFLFWTMIENDYPGKYTRKQVASIMQNLFEQQPELAQEIKQDVAQVNGLDEWGNSPGRTQEASGGAESPSPATSG